MKPYGNDPYENLACRYGCCSGKYVLRYKLKKHKQKRRKNYHLKIIRRSRKRARQKIQQEINLDSVSFLS